MATDLYHRALKHTEPTGTPEFVKLFHRFWDDRPWMVDAFTGSIIERRDIEIRQWCLDHFGEEAWPLHDRPGRWVRGSVTIHGYTWFGFASEDDMNAFLAAWPDPKAEPKK